MSLSVGSRMWEENARATTSVLSTVLHSSHWPCSQALYPLLTTHQFLKTLTYSSSLLSIPSSPIPQLQCYHRRPTVFSVLRFDIKFHIKVLIRYNLPRGQWPDFTSFSIWHHDLPDRYCYWQWWWLTVK